MSLRDLLGLPPQQFNTSGRVDPSKMPAGFLDAYRAMDSGGARPYALIGGAQLGMDNNYQYAVYPDGRIEPAYQGFDPTYDPNTSATPDPGMRYRTLSELLAQGGQRGGVDSHGMPLIQGDVGGYRYAPQPDMKNGPGGLGDAIGLGAFTLMTMGLGSAAAGGAGAGMAGAAEGMSAADAATLGAMTEGGGLSAGAGATGLAGGTAAAASGPAATGTTAAAAGPGEWADLSGWLGADASGAPAYDATEAALNSSMIAGAGGSTSGAIGGASAGAGTAGAAAAGGGTALGRLLSGNGTTADYASLAGNLGIAGLGYYGASRQADSLAGIAAENRADRMPFYAKSLEYLNNPSAYASGPGQAALQANLRALSVNGNPADNPALLGIATSSALRDWRDAVTGFGNIGLSGSDTRASLMSGSANADANALNALGYGIGSTLNPPSTIEQLLKQLKGAGVGLA